MKKPKTRKISIKKLKNQRHQVRNNYTYTLHIAKVN